MQGISNEAQRSQVDYLVGGLRIGVDEESNTPGPRSHILGFCEGLRREGLIVRTFLASRAPGLKRFAKIREGHGASGSSARLLVSDVVRAMAACWSGALVFSSSLRSEKPYFIYERVAVMQSLTSFHRWKGRVTRVVESNGLMAMETAGDRNALLLKRVAVAVERHVYRRADLIVAVSDALAEEIANFAGITRDKILVLPNAIPFVITDDAVLKVRQPRNGEPGLRIGFVGAVVKWQQLDVLIEAMARMGAHDRQQLHLDLVGEGPEMPELKERVSRHRLNGSVTFHGRLPQREALNVLRQCDLGYSGHVETVGARMYHSPLKLYEYAGLGLGAIVTPSEDAVALRMQGMPLWEFTDLITLCLAMKDALGTHEALVKYRTDLVGRVVEQNTWSSRAHELIETIRPSVEAVRS
ncbi:glycosyltransferase [Agromyces albus]|uniref:glycosyltransferase n=1 Tax=Agromyces albus TaxID=205332 RepID=UPI0027895EFA|nr:glycosyltransferase [Agromyces albus]MDQ0574557.1 glycosyltransferase involved in cell wall biosynthesis [Agromyces albus]